MRRSSALQQLTFQAKLERISSSAAYFAVSVPLKISLALKTRGPVPVSARVNSSDPFLVSLFPVGNGRHYIRIKAKIREATRIKAGDRVRVQITVLDRTAEISLPKDLASALRAERALDDFQSLPAGKRRYMLRWIDEAAKPETRARRIQDGVEEAHRKREKQNRAKS